MSHMLHLPMSFWSSHWAGLVLLIHRRYNTVVVQLSWGPGVSNMSDLSRLIRMVLLGAIIKEGTELKIIL